MPGWLSSGSRFTRRNPVCCTLQESICWHIFCESHLDSLTASLSAGSRLYAAEYLPRNHCVPSFLLSGKRASPSLIVGRLSPSNHRKPEARPGYFMPTPPQPPHPQYSHFSFARTRQVVVLNYCRGLQAKFLAKLVDHAKHLRRLEIYGKHRSSSNAKQAAKHARICATTVEQGIFGSAVLGRQQSLHGEQERTLLCVIETIQLEQTSGETSK